MVVEGWWVEIAASVVTFVVAYVGAITRRWLLKTIDRMDESDANRQALEALLEGMAKAQKESIRGIKAASEDGKLTKEEIDRMETVALTHAKDIATGPAKDVILSWSKERASSLIKQLLAKYKGKK